MLASTIQRPIIIVIKVMLYHIAGGFADLYFRELLTGANFAKNIFTIRPKHVGALREEGVAPKMSRNIFSRLTEIRENKCL